MNDTLKKYLHIQYIWFTIWFVGVFVGVFYQMVNQNFKDLDQIISFFITYIFIFYIPSAILLIIGQFILSKFRYPALYFYYHIWIDRLYRFFHNCDLTKKGVLNRISSIVIERWFNPYGERPNRDDLILESFPKNIITKLSNNPIKDYPIFVQQMALGNRPVIVRREDLLEKSFLKKWAYASVLYFKPIKIFKPSPKQSRLIIDLRNESYGIYNNAGKLFLKMHYLSNKNRIKSLIDKSRRLESFINSNESGEKEFQFHIPFRWANGGILPIAEYMGKEWFVLFSRDIEPVGLNIPNGSSEDKEEYKNLYGLIYREFGEELILLDQKPDWNSVIPVNQKIFRYPYEREEEHDQLIIHEKFAIGHQQMRRIHDGINIVLSKGPEIERIKTPFTVEITYQDNNLKEKNKQFPNVIFNVNPTEFGIEICHVGKFRMDDDDYLLDGEIWNDEFLVRQPIILVSCSFIKNLYEQTESIGTSCSSDDCYDCRTINCIPCGEYVLFNADLEFRKSRLDNLKESGDGDSTEAQRIRRWLDKNDKIFAGIDPSKTDLNSQDHPYLTRLCPVTWKIFENLCYNNLI
jgi:hypothetical protein